MIWLILLFLWIVLGFAFYYTLWKDSDEEVVDYVMFFSPLNIVIGLIVGISYIYDGVVIVYKFFRRKQLRKKYKDVDPYGEENWDEK